MCLIKDSHIKIALSILLITSLKKFHYKKQSQYCSKNREDFQSPAYQVWHFDN